MKRRLRPRPLWRSLLLLPFLALLAVNVAAFVAWTLPRTLQERSIASRVEALRGEAEREGRRADEARARSEAIKANAEDVERFYKEVVAPRKAALVPTIEELEKAASELGLRTQTTTYTQEELKGAPLVRFVITMPLSGSYRQLVSFLQRLERWPRFVTVDSVQLREGAAVEAALSVVLSAYFKPEEKRGA